MNDKFYKPAIAHFMFFISGLCIGLGGMGIYSNSCLDNSNDIIQGIEAENIDLKNRLGNIQTAVDNLGTGIEGSAASAGNIADGIGGVITGIDESIAILGDLIGFVEQIETILIVGNP